MEAVRRRQRARSRGVLRDGREADRGIRRRSAPAACHAEREEAVVGVVGGRAAGLKVRRGCARRPRPVEQEGVEIRSASDAADEQRGDEECQDSCGRGAAHEP